MERGTIIAISVVGGVVIIGGVIILANLGSKSTTPVMASKPDESGIFTLGNIDEKFKTLFGTAQKPKDSKSDTTSGIPNDFFGKLLNLFSSKGKDQYATGTAGGREGDDCDLSDGTEGVLRGGKCVKK